MLRFKTQADAISWIEKNGHLAIAARIRAAKRREKKSIAGAPLEQTNYVALAARLLSEQQSCGRALSRAARRRRKKVSTSSA
jgi:hypothetical protein